MSKYEVLGVPRSAPLQEIKGAYQAAALATHPDKHANLATDVIKKQVVCVLSAATCCHCVCLLLADLPPPCVSVNCSLCLVPMIQPQRVRSTLPLYTYYPSTYYSTEYST